MKRHFTIGTKVRMSTDALDNYGNEYAERIFVIEQWYDHYVKPQLMEGDTHGHPGYDNNTDDCLYHLKGLQFDLYSWELVVV